MKNLSLRSEIKRKSYLKIYSLFDYLLFDHFATMGAERRLGALPPATRSGRPQWMPTHARAVIMVSSFRFQAGGDDCVPRQRSRTAMLQKICKLLRGNLVMSEKRRNFARFFEKAQVTYCLTT